MNIKKSRLLLYVLCLILFSLVHNVSAQPVDKIDPKERCKVCGMFVIKYHSWLTQIETTDLTIMFDGPKDMFAYYFEPNQFEGKPVQKTDSIYLKDYYTLEWINAREAYFVFGSDVYGPMGHELIPFNSLEAANNFKKDHKGKKILTFDQVNIEIINSLRSGQTMKGMK